MSSEPPQHSALATQHSAPIINITGTKIALGPPSIEQLPNYVRWFNDFQTMRTQGDPEPAPRTLDELRTWYDGEMSGNPTRFWFSVYALPDLRHIGFVDLHQVDFRNRVATMSLMVGEPEARGKGYGTEMARLILDYGFTVLGLTNIMLECYEYNAAGRRAYERAGFREFARRTEAHMMGGKFWDIIYMECLAEEFESPVLAGVFTPDVARYSDGS